MNRLQTFFKLTNSQDVFYNVAVGVISNKDLKRFSDSITGFTGIWNRIRKSTIPSISTSPKEVKQEDKSKLDMLVFGPDEERLDYELAVCCNPIPGDKVFGFITVGKGIKVHKNDCPNAISLRANYDYRVIKATWIDSSKREFKAILNLDGLDRAGMISDITLVISKNNSINMTNLNFSEQAGIFTGVISLLIKNKDQLEHVIDELKKVEGVRSVKRTYKKD